VTLDIDYKCFAVWLTVTITNHFYVQSIVFIIINNQL
jgi:hypothetical protein